MVVSTYAQMNRHERRTLDSLHKKFADSLKSDIKPYEPHEQEVITAFLKDVARYKRETGQNAYPRVFGAFGEWEGADGFIEKVIESEDGRRLKLWGCSFLLKGVHDRRMIKTLDMGKWLFSEFPRDMIGKEPILRNAIVRLAFFHKKRFILFCDKLMHAVLNRTIALIEIPEKDYCKEVKEIRRAAFWVIHEQYGIEYSKDDLLGGGTNFGLLLMRAIRFIILFLECDTAYLFRIQDAFGMLKSRGIEAFWEGLDILISREVGFEGGIGKKWKFIKLALKFGMWRYPEFKRFLDAFFNELDYEKIKMDDNDKYFSLTYLSYNFGGRTKDDRFAERARIDKERKHVFIKK